MSNQRAEERRRVGVGDPVRTKTRDLGGERPRPRTLLVSGRRGRGVRGRTVRPRRGHHLAGVRVSTTTAGTSITTRKKYAPRTTRAPGWSARRAFLAEPQSDRVCALARDPRSTNPGAPSGTATLGVATRRGHQPRKRKPSASELTRTRFLMEGSARDALGAAQSNISDGRAPTPFRRSRGAARIRRGALEHREARAASFGDLPGRRAFAASRARISAARARLRNPLSAESSFGRGRLKPAAR